LQRKGTTLMLKLSTLVAEMDSELPPLEPGEMRYVLGSGGVYVQRDTSLFTSTTTVDEGGLPHLLDVQERLLLKTPRLPATLIAQAVGFLEKVYEVYRGEGALVLLYDPQRREYQWYCPVQQSSWNVHFETPEDLSPHLILFGDIHSHPDSRAIPSMVDTADERQSDGLHIIVGEVGITTKMIPHWKKADKYDHLHYHVDFCVDGKRWTMDEKILFEKVLTESDGPFPEPPEEWMAKVTKGNHFLRSKRHRSRYRMGFGDWD
jgi:proteasome lid subunit RPN8/RPN11